MSNFRFRLHFFFTTTSFFFFLISSTHDFSISFALSLTHFSLILFLFSFSFIYFLYLKVLLLLTSVIKSTWDFTNSLSSRSLYNKFNAIFALWYMHMAAVGLSFYLDEDKISMNINFRKQRGKKHTHTRVHCLSKYTCIPNMWCYYTYIYTIPHLIAKLF